MGIAEFKGGLIAVECNNSKDQEEILRVAAAEGINWKNGQKALKYCPYKIGLHKVYIYIRNRKLIYSLKMPPTFKVVSKVC